MKIRWLNAATAIALCTVLSAGNLMAQDSPEQKPETKGKSLPAETTTPEKDQLVVKLPMGEERSPAVTFKVSLTPSTAREGDVVRMKVEATIVDGWHINAVKEHEDAVGLPTTIELTSKNLTPIGGTFEPSAEAELIDSDGLKQFCHAGVVSWTRDYRVSESGLKKTEGWIRFQACDDEKCLPPQKLTFSLAGKRLSKPSPVAINEAKKPIGDPIEVTLQECNLTRPRAKLSLIGLFFGSRTDELVLQGQFQHDEDTYKIYLPNDSRYKLENRSTGNNRSQNSASHISVDHDHNGSISAWETHAANIPFRVEDAMYQVVRIDKDKKTLALQRVDTKLTGALVGRKVAPFSFKTVDGETISDKSILGKVTMLDVWAVTCHNCYEKFPRVQRIQNKHTKEKLRVILLSTDRTQQAYDARASQLFAHYGGADWPSVVLPNSFDSAMHFGDFGYGIVVIDKQGVVRSVNPHNIEAVVAEVMKED